MRAFTCPNYVYAWCLRRSTVPPKECQNWDLPSIRGVCAGISAHRRSISRCRHTWAARIASRTISVATVVEEVGAYKIAASTWSRCCRWASRVNERWCRVAFASREAAAICMWVSTSSLLTSGGKHLHICPQSLIKSTHLILVHLGLRVVVRVVGFAVVDHGGAVYDGVGYPEQMG